MSRLDSLQVRSQTPISLWRSPCRRTNRMDGSAQMSPLFNRNPSHTMVGRSFADWAPFSTCFVGQWRRGPC